MVQLNGMPISSRRVGREFDLLEVEIMRKILGVMSAGAATECRPYNFAR
jgi:hypothetical protein